MKTKLNQWNLKKDISDKRKQKSDISPPKKKSSSWKHILLW